MLLNMPTVYQEMFLAWNAIRDTVEFDLNLSSILEQPLFLNPKIMHEGNLIHFNFFIEAGIVKLRDILYEVIPGFLRMSAIKEMVHDKNPDISNDKVEKAFMIIKNSLPFHWLQTIRKKVKVENDNTKREFILNVNGKHFPLSLCRTNVLYQSLLNMIIQPPISRLYWERLYNSFHTTKYAEMIHLSSKMPDMIDLDFRIFHNIIYTNKILQKIGITDTEMCNYCKNEVEDIVHLFFKCKRVKQFIAFVLNNIETLLKDVPNHCINTMNCEQMLLLGYCERNKKVNLFFVNMFLSISRLCIFRTRNLYIQHEKEIDIVKYFKSSLHNNLTVMLKYYKTKKTIEEFHHLVLKNNSLVKMGPNNIQINW